MPALTRFSVLKHYSKPSIQESILRECDHREVAVSFGGKGYGKRPDMLQYKNDIYEFARQGATSFHVSLERWEDPLALAPGMAKRELDNLRIGWDLVFDLDSKFVDYSKAAALLIMEALEGVSIDRKSLGIKFSGNRGFHLCIPFESIPSSVNMVDSRLGYPEIPKAVIEYVKSIIKEQLSQRLLEMNSIKEIAQATGKSEEEISPRGIFNPFAVVDIDSQALSSRHLIRAPFSINEKSGLVSIPVAPHLVASFSHKQARIESIEPGVPFFKTPLASDATHLIMQSIDYVKRNLKPMFGPMSIGQDAPAFGKRNPLLTATQKIPPDYFPPCMKLALAGIKSDGRKRAVFFLNNFLRNVGYAPAEIHAMLEEWNAKNYEPLREGYVVTQLKWHNRNPAVILPPNCANEAYYLSMNLCHPDTFCPKIKNPAQYTLKKFKIFSEQQKPKRLPRKASASAQEKKSLG